MDENLSPLNLSQEVNLELVRIPAGEFWMGSDIWSYREKPKHRVFLPDYWMGKFPITVEQYAAFVKAKGYSTRPGQIDNMPRYCKYPVVSVTWHEAQDFCRWLNEELLAGLEQYKTWRARLPSEAEWEKAARGTDGRDYPWGNQQPDENLCNFDWNVKNITPVGHYSPQGDSPYGCADMAGNVWEWTRSLDKTYPYNAGDGREDETESGDRVVRGGSLYNYGNFMRCAYRATNDPDRFYTSRGFRLCLSPIHL